MQKGGLSQGNQDTRDWRLRQMPRNKKFHCAFHKNKDGQHCYSNLCIDLKKIVFTERMKLLEENGDCQKCCRDCPTNNC